MAVCGDEATAALPELATTPAEELLEEMPLVVVPASEPNHVLVAGRPSRAAVPTFESFLADGWQRWIGASN